MSLRYMPGSRSAESYSISLFHIKRKQNKDKNLPCHFPKELWRLQLASNTRGFPIAHILTSTCYVLSFNCDQCHGCEVVFIVVLTFITLITNNIESLFGISYQNMIMENDFLKEMKNLYPSLLRNHFPLSYFLIG